MDRMSLAVAFCWTQRINWPFSLLSMAFSRVSSWLKFDPLKTK
jgi:hypothetical protein